MKPKFNHFSPGWIFIEMHRKTFVTLCNVIDSTRVKLALQKQTRIYNRLTSNKEKCKRTHLEHIHVPYIFLTLLKIRFMLLLV
jgi:hypothetical protein